MFVLSALFFSSGPDWIRPTNTFYEICDALTDVDPPKPYFDYRDPNDWCMQVRNKISSKNGYVHCVS